MPEGWPEIARAATATLQAAQRPAAPVDSAGAIAPAAAAAAAQLPIDLTAAAVEPPPDVWVQVRASSARSLNGCCVVLRENANDDVPATAHEHFLCKKS